MCSNASSCEEKPACPTESSFTKLAGKLEKVPVRLAGTRTGGGPVLRVAGGLFAVAVYIYFIIAVLRARRGDTRPGES